MSCDLVEVFTLFALKNCRDYSFETLRNQAFRVSGSLLVVQFAHGLFYENIYMAHTRQLSFLSIAG
jgi:hypothetical protein